MRLPRFCRQSSEKIRLITLAAVLKKTFFFTAGRVFFEKRQARVGDQGDLPPK
jgi:hypothetical protein